MAVDVLVLGAGLAGLSCARDLAEGGAEVLVVEARNRPGGRVEGGVLRDGRSVEFGGEIVGPADPWSYPDAARLDRVSLGDFLHEEGATSNAYRLVELHSLGAGGGTVGRSSLLGVLRAIAAGGGHLQSDYEAWESLKVDGGSSTLVRAMADGLGDRIRFGAPVRRVEIGSPCTIELGGGERIKASAVVCTIPILRPASQRP